MTTSTTMSSTLTNTTYPEIQDDSDRWNDSSTPRITFLSVFICIGFLGNLFLIITVCHSRRFRSVAFYIFVSNLAITNICECLLNMTVLLTVTISNAWTFGNVACRVSAFFLHLICIEVILSLTILTTDRLIAVRFKEKYEHVFSTPRISIMICYTWFQSLAFSLPVTIGAVPSSANYYIKHCSIAKGGSIVYGTISTLACVIVPLVLMIVFFVKIIRTGYKDRTLIRSLISQHNYKDESQPEPRIKTEIRYTNITGTLCIAWLVVNGPYVVTLYFNMLQSSSELDEVSDKEVEYVWYVDLVLLWLRFSFTLVLPIAAFTWNKELWKSFKDMILCRKNNSIVDESFRKNETDTQKLERKINEEQNREKEKEKKVIIPTPRETHVFHVPVLFATSDGVHVRTQEDDSESENSDSKNGGTLRGKKCDVLGSQDQLNKIGDDTSDYDTGTEMDPFSVSHPVSGMRKIIDRSQYLSGRHRSASQPEVRDKSKKDNSIGTMTVRSTSAADSGLDLSIMNNTSPSQDLKEMPKSTQKEAFIHTESIDSENPNQQSEADTSDKSVAPGVNLDQKDMYSENKICDMESNDFSTVKGMHCSDSKNDQFIDLKSASEISLDSPIPKRRKKKRRQDKSDLSSQGTASPILPPRPPPRLAPITSNIKTQGSGPGRPGSSCSSQISSLEIKTMHTVEAYTDNTDFTKADLTSLDNLSLSSFTSRNIKTTVNTLTSFENDNFCVEFKRTIPSVPEEVMSYNDDHRSDDKIVSGENEKQINSEVSADCLNERMENKPPSVGRNSEARKKRREKIAGNSILNEGKGYTRLKSDS